ncbi:class I SAM-dependent methyltransferase [Paenibacillus sp. URB8-2]|uniref:class I SAM-dependent methyltransferase n=1 Tax=Paenibacillus sp. URB8-2 TaxID=2741301 RepID=UPI0015C2B102|nr:class I SAM-dependent methyltransferase [Paenibacillus sp. URB8-2]BCG59332.1 type 11 methyltransferase [Paenibacillus sp. URB8-2]
MNTSSTPQLYHWIVRPKWFTKKYIHDQIKPRFAFNDKIVLDFGSGTGANCSMFQPVHYLGIDPDAKRIHYARRSYPDYKFHVLEHGKLPVDNESVDYILIVAVLHHISSEEIADYMKEFKRILKPDGNIIVMEPCICKKKPLCNWFMNFYDDGEYIRREEEYIQLFRENEFTSQVINRFRKGFLYHELFFTANLRST